MSIFSVQNRACSNPCWNCSSLLARCVSLSRLCSSNIIAGTLCPGGADQCIEKY